MNFLDLDGNLFPPEKISAQTQGMKNEMMKFFPKSGNFSLSNFFQSQNFFFFGEIFFQISSPDFGKPQKFHDFVLYSPGFERSCWK